MLFFQNILRMMDRQMKTPQLFGWFHIVSLTLTVLVTMALCFRHKEDSPNRVRAVVFGTAVLVALAEIYKQINYSFSYSDGITFDYQWYAFPFQFCSTPMFVGALTGIFRKGRVHEALCAYLATFAFFAEADLWKISQPTKSRLMHRATTVTAISFFIYRTSFFKMLQL